MLKIRDLTVHYGDVTALQAVDLTVSPGEILALIGPNGAGKSTLIRALSGVLPLHGGEVVLDGKNITAFTPKHRAQHVAVVPQSRQLGGTFTVRQTVMLGRTPHLGLMGKATPHDEAKVDWAMEKTLVQNLSERRLAEISGGEQQRVLLARALAQDTPVLLLDEPTNHLDLQHQMNILSLVRKLVSEQNLTVLMAMHDLNLVSFFADRVALLVDSELQNVGSLEEVLTAQNIAAAYQTQVQTIPHPDSGVPLILPDSMET
ncbi:MAG: Fe(3+) dicitrate transport ATP-binding protein FecE [Chloroflexi bacterium]|nr:Fe(3+) dicitrate transport ATP-binding protein FecE [Chloroflexota bacterium]